MLLEEEITGRYYLERGAIESTFDKDPDVQAAIKVLSDPQELNAILSN